MSLSARARRTDRALLALLAVTAVALLARLVLLGDRVAHWDEGRVGYDILRYAATGAWEYRPIVHGPFLPQVNRVVFEVLGATDVTSRLVVAVVGALLPLSAWLYREHLRDVELVALGLFLAFDPVLLYYSRFMRNDVLLATFMFAALGCYVRTVDTGRARYLLAGTALMAFGFTTKENAIVYVAAVVGATVLLFDHRLLLVRHDPDGPPWTDVARDRLRRTARGLWALRLALLVALVEFLVVVVLFYAPREAADGGVGLWAAFAQPSMFPAVLEEATVGSARKLGGLWLGGQHQKHAYLPFLGHYAWILGSASGGLVLLSVFGFVYDRYAGEGPRDLVLLAFAWGLVSVLGYPAAVDIRAAWSVVHALVPLAVPAAVGVGVIVDWARAARERDDRVGVGLAAVVLLLVGGQLAGTAVMTSYVTPQGEGNVLVQYAQPAEDVREPVALVGDGFAEHEGVDAVWYGDHFALRNENVTDRLPAGGCVGDPSCWYNRLPVPWYLEQHGAEVASTASADEVAALVREDRPPVVVTRAQDAADVAPHLDGYREFRREGRQFSLVFVFYVDERYAGDAGASPREAAVGTATPPATG